MDELFNFDAEPNELIRQLIHTFANTPNVKTMYSAINYFLKIFLSFPSVEFTSFFLLNNNTYEFEYYQSFPLEYETYADVIFDYLTEEGIVGSAVQTRSISHSTENKFEKILIVVPVISFSNIEGLMLMSVQKLDKAKLNYYENSIQLLCSHFANKISNLQLLESQEQLESVLEQKVAERTISLLKSKQEMHEKYNEMRNNLTMSLPHEIRTPMGMITGNSDFLMKHLDDLSYDDIHDVSKDINNSAIRITRLFENYIYFANLELTAIDPIALENLQKNKLEYYADLLRTLPLNICSKHGRQDDLRVNVLDVPIMFSEEHFIKLVNELMDNIIKYSTPSTPIVIESYQADNELIISFTDHGRGMTTEQINSIDAYIQFERGQYEQQGMGLGLAIVRRIVNLHNGSVWFESEPLVYTKVNIRLMLA